MEFQIDMHLKKNSPKGIAINKIPIRKASELFGIVHFVFFSPEDLNIIKDGPAGRRRFIDLELSQIDKVYLSNLSNYNLDIQQEGVFTGKPYCLITKNKDERLKSLGDEDLTTYIVSNTDSSVLSLKSSTDILAGIRGVIKQCKEQKK